MTSPRQTGKDRARQPRPPQPQPQPPPGMVEVLFSRAFRPFFFAAGVFGGLLLLLWMLTLAGVFAPPSHLSARDWHVHEMLFGYFVAAMSGFLLTAVPNWTGRLPITGRPLMLLAALWLAGRLLMLFSALLPFAAIIVDAAFLLVFAGLLWREIIAGGNRRNVAVAMMVSLLAAANLLFHAEWLFGVPTLLLAERVALAMIAGLIMLIGGRIVPSFTRNWLMKKGITDEARLPASFGGFDRAVLLSGALALAVWVAWPREAFTGALLVLAGLLHLLRLARWRGWQTGREALVWILHAGYLWLPLWMLLMAAALFGFWPVTDALHVLTAGAIVTMTLAVMTRATRGHSGRPLRADGVVVTIYLLALAGAVTRVLAPLLPVMMAWHLSATLQLLALWLFAFSHAPMFLRPRIDQFPPR